MWVHRALRPDEEAPQLPKFTLEQFVVKKAQGSSVAPSEPVPAEVAPPGLLSCVWDPADRCLDACVWGRGGGGGGAGRRILAHGARDGYPGWRCTSLRRQGMHVVLCWLLLSCVRVLGDLSVLCLSVIDSDALARVWDGYRWRSRRKSSGRIA